MGTTAVPSIQFTPTGLVLPQEADILQGVQTDLNTAAGGNLSTTLTSPMGQVAQSETAIIGDKNDQIAAIAAQFDPNTSSGRWQDALGQIYFMDRIEASGSVVTGNCTGLVGATIPAGSIVQDQAGYLWSSLSAVTFDATGSASPSFQCQTTGPIACPPGTLTTIYAAVIGWDSVTNAGAATPGTNVETRADFEYRRRQSVATNAVNSVNSIRARVLAVPNVLDAYVIDNPKGVVVNTGATNYPVAANSVYVAVVGGDPVAVANAIWGKKSLGCNYNGNTSQIIYDTSQGSLPYPQYTVTWNTPSNLPIYITVNLAINTNLPANIIALVQAAVLAAFNGQDGGARARIASQLYAGRYFAGVAAINPNVEIYSINLGVAASPSGTAVLLGIDQRPTLTAGNIVVTQS